MPAAIARILAVMEQLRSQGCDLETGLVVCFRDREGARCERLQFLRPDGRYASLAPLIKEPPARLVAHLLERVLFNVLLADLPGSFSWETRCG